MEGQAFSHYQVLERLGGGGMGVVYKALDTTLDRHVALKFLSPDLTRDDEARRRFMQEAKAASALDHPNVCAIHEIASTPDDQLFIAMGYYEGETLKHRVARGPLPIVEALDIVRQAGEGLAEAHATGIVHRDIKPANIIVTTSGLVKILDFGIAKLSGATGLTQTGITLGTVSYMSPEQVQGNEAGPQSDVWSLGAVFYELLTGTLPFPGDRPAVVMHGITDRAPAPVRELCPEASPAVVHVVTRALEKSQARRYATARDFVAAMPVAAGDTEGPPLTEATRLTEATADLGAEASEVPSIAVMPFANLSADPEQEFFCEGMADEIINALTALEGLRVSARSSSFQAQARDLDVGEIGRRLKVGTVLEGSVRKAGNRLRVTAQLVHAADGFHLWSQRYDRQMDDVFAVQDEIARAVVTELKVKLLGVSSQPMVTRPTESLEAYACYLQGRHHRFTRSNMLRASQCYEEAVQHDPDFAAAWAGAADAAVGGGHHMLWPPAEASRKAKVAVERALMLDDNMSEAHAALARIRFWFDWQWADAEREFERALELNPADVATRSSYAAFLAYMCRTEEALAQVAQAQLLDPLSAHAPTNGGIALQIGHRHDEAIAAFGRALDLQPDNTNALWHLSFSHHACGRHDEALRHLDTASARTKRSPVHSALLGLAFGLAGQEDVARRLLSDVRDRSQHEYVSPRAFALIHFGLGELDEGVHQLEKVYEERSPAVLYLQTLVWDPIRDHPRVQDLRRRVGLPDPMVDRQSSGPST